MNQGDRLAFSNGILVLSASSPRVLIVVFRGDTQSLLPLYMIGVFVSFTLSQAGMVIHWRSDPGARLEDERAHQRLRRGRHRRRAGHRRDHQDARRRVDRPAADSRCIVDGVQGDATGTTITSRPQLTLQGLRAAATASTTPSSMPIGGIQRAVVEALRYARDAVRRRPGGLRGRRSRRRPKQLQTRLGDLGRARAAGRPAVAVPIADGAAARVHRAGRPTNVRTTTSRSFCRSSCRRAGGSTCCTTSARCSSRARCSSGRTSSSRACRSIWRSSSRPAQAVPHVL